jgi:hypothetical protein
MLVSWPSSGVNRTGERGDVESANALCSEERRDWSSVAIATLSSRGHCGERQRTTDTRVCDDRLRDRQPQVMARLRTVESLLRTVRMM